MTYDNIDNELKIAVDDFQKNINKIIPSKCSLVVSKVLENLKVQSEIIKLLKSGPYEFDHYSCESCGVDQTQVTFMFRCIPPKICFIHPGIIVTYDHTLQEVVSIKQLYF